MKIFLATLMSLSFVAYFSCAHPGKVGEQPNPGDIRAVAVSDATSAPQDISLDDYNKKVTSDKLVMVDFFATWCGPCKQLRPTLDKIADAQKATLQLMPLDIDQNPTVSNNLQIQYIPTLILYKAGKQVWRNTGYTTEDVIMAAIRQNSN